MKFFVDIPGLLMVKKRSPNYLSDLVWTVSEKDGGTPFKEHLHLFYAMLCL